MFINRSMSVDQPFKPQRMRGLSLDDMAAELGARWHRGVLDRVEHDQRRGVTRDGDELPYDMLVLAVGARSGRESTSEEVLTYPRRSRRPQLPAAAAPDPRWPGQQARLRQTARAELAVAAVRPGAPDRGGLRRARPLPGRAHRRHARGGAARHLRQRRERRDPRPARESGIALHTSSYGAPGQPGMAGLSPGERRLPVDRVVTLPRLAARDCVAIPCGPRRVPPHRRSRPARRRERRVRCR